ncbi:putative ascorbate peroxidase [Clytia hemisphaerica]|uniref:putative ascorbate peroxidase n=1 Tax=Clytia hemisphaerica TaxID=252671 RepID=UPI0034D3C7DB
MEALKTIPVIDGNIKNTDERPFIAGLVRLAFHDCVDEDEANENFPDAKWNLNAVEDFFENDGFVFDPADVVAILGAHSLGRAHTSNSGYEGKWLNGFRFRNPNVAHSDVLDNFYYRQINNDGWNQIQLADDGNFQWQQNDIEQPVAPLDAEGFPLNPTRRRDPRQVNMFLNVDMALRWDLGTPNSQNGEVACSTTSTPPTCPDSPRFNLFDRYRRNNGNFINAFEIAFEKMVESKETETLLEA